VRFGNTSIPLRNRVSLIALLLVDGIYLYRESDPQTTWETIMPLMLASPAIPAGGEIPAEYTCDGTDISPP
jgi:hypothetical protein